MNELAHSHERELRALMTAGLDGDAGADHRLLERLTCHLRAYYRHHFARIGHGLTEAEDLLQEALIAVHTHRHTYDRLQPFTPWIRAIARYKFLDYLRRTKSSFKDLPMESAQELTSNSDMTAVESGVDLQRLLSEISSKAREAIQYVKLDGLSVSETAARSGMSRGGGKGSGASRLEGVGLTDQTGERHVNTDRLVDLLSTNLEPVGRVQFGRTLLLAMLTGGAAAFTLMLATVGPRADLDSTAHLEWTAVKLLFALSMIATAAPLLLRSMRPGLEKEMNPAVVLLPFFVAIAAALVMLLFVTPQAWSAMLRGATSVSAARCLLCTIFFAAVPFAALIWALRQGAPTRLRLSGAIAGVVAGGFGAAAYALNCRSDTIPFIAVWYGAAIALCALIGAQLGPRLLRW